MAGPYRNPLECSLPAAALIAAFVLGEPAWRWYSGLTGTALVIGLVAFGRAWENDSEHAGLVQRVTIVLGWSRLGPLFVHGAA